MSVTDTSIYREIGLQMRREAIVYFTSNPFLEQLEEILATDSLARSLTLPASLLCERVLADMATDHGWAEEFWTIDDSAAVHLVSDEEFFEVAGIRRFSRSDTLRRPRPDAYALRGFLSGLHSPEVSAAFSSVAHLDGVRYKSADIARYRPGHYLRRHDDVYDGRIFGLVFFPHDNWDPRWGTHLIAEKPDGRCAVVEPVPGSVAVMRLAGGHFHQVQPNNSDSWDRYSIAVHFGVDGA